MTQKTIGPITVYFPDENDASFSIVEDCAGLFGVEYQSEAYQQLKASLKDTRPKPFMSYEADNLSIRSANVETMLAIITHIAGLSIKEYTAAFAGLSIENLRQEFIFAKKNRPKPKPWNTGDVFVIPLEDTSYAVGQVLEKGDCTCALFDLRLDTIATIPAIDLDKLQPVSIVHLSNGDLLNNGSWQVLFNEKVTLDPSSGHGGKTASVGSVSYGSCSVMTELAEACYGLRPWNVLYREDYYDNMLLKGRKRPSTAKVLSADERTEYRLRHFKAE